jgi:sarcosine oxidase subunit alpha
MVLKKVEKISMFKRMNNAITNSKTVRLTIEGKEISAIQGDSVAAAMLVSGFACTRITHEEGKRRAPYCMMGICFDCMVEINGIPNQRACQILVQEGMRVNIQEKEGNLNI